MQVIEGQGTREEGKQDSEFVELHGMSGTSWDGGSGLQMERHN